MSPILSGSQIDLNGLSMIYTGKISKKDIRYPGQIGRIDPNFNIIISGSVRRSDLEKKALQMEDLRYQKRQCESYCEESPNIANPFHVLKTSTEMRFATQYFT